MGKKDITWEMFFSDDSRYADIINAFGCSGEQIVTAKDLIEVDTRSVLNIPRKIFDTIFEKAGIKYQRIRDAIRKTAFGMNFMLIGIESQESINYRWPLTCIEYDVAQYEKQAMKLKKEIQKREGISSGEYLYGFAKDAKLHAAVTFLIYSGEERWDAPERLQDMLDLDGIPEKLKHMVLDYKPYVIDVRHMPSTDGLKTDVKLVFDFIRCCDNRDKMIKLVDNNEEYQHLESDAFDVMAEYTNSEELNHIKEESRTEGGSYDMCRAIKELIADGRSEGISIGRSEGISIGRNEGISIGRSEGEKKTLIRMVCRKMAKGKIVSEIADDLEEEAAEIDKIYQAALKYAPDFDVDEIYEALHRC